MTTHRAIACALALSLAATTSVWGAENKKKTVVKKAVGRTETLACRLGTEDRHARIAVVVIKGKTDSFAYYSKWKPRTCSIYLERNRDPYSKWADTGDVTTISLEKGAFLIEHKPGEYHFIFRNVDRERYCGMDGVINGTLTIKRGKDQCVLGGEIMAEGTPLGHVPAAYASVDGGATAPATASAAAKPAKDQGSAGEQAQTKSAAAEPAPEKAKSAAAEPVKAQAAASGAAEKKTAAAEGASETAQTAETQTAETQTAEPEPVKAQTVASEPAEAKTASADATPEKAQTAEAESPKDEAETAERPAIQAPQAGPTETTTTAAAEPAAETPARNPLRAFFRALAPSSPEKDTPFPN